MIPPRGRSLSRQQQDGIFFLRGLMVTLAVQAAIATLVGAVLALLTALAPASLKPTLEAIGGPHLSGNVMVAALVQAVIWGWLPYIRFVPRRLGRWVMRGMAVTTLILFLLVLVEIW
jgi:ABC-type amino acid transport system permease subunit